ncbi:RICIN domain-containing protein [uncultured Holdemanella sp.]|uniref:RICIN domain-containing protein n=1 Tax=uncultured Holdemanella sp. TaxID=1763549 RepID=UPI0025FF6811|nr:RICIN domain-containing protein [uncultured Holdemanella sp.]
MNSRDIVKVGFAVLAAVVSYNFADTIVHAEENSVEPIKETTNTQESDTLVDVIDSVVNPDVSVSIDDEKDSMDTSSKLLDGWNTDYTMFVKDGSYVTSSFEDIDGQKYYFDENGNKVTGLKTIGTDAYYFNESGVLQSNMQLHHDDNTGTVLYSLMKEDGKNHYYLENGMEFSGMAHLDGKIYYFENGVQSFGEKQVNGNWYNFKNDGTLSVGFVNVGNSAKYYDNFGKRLQGTFQIDKVTYNTDNNGLITKASWNGVSYYCQRDDRWAWSVYGNYTFASSGCVPTTAAMIVNTLKGTNYTPIDMGNLLYNAGIYNVREIGAGGDTWSLISNRFGLVYKNNINMESAKNELMKGNMIAATVEGGRFCPWPGISHEILLFGLDAQGYTTVYDPYTSTRNGRVHISEVFNHPSSFGLDKIDGGPFFSLGKYVDTTLYLDVSKGTGHVGNVYYTGNKVEPEVNVSIKNTGLVQGRDYKVIYSNNVDIGKGTVTIVGVNMFTGKLTLSFDIIKDEMTNGTYEIVSSKNNNKVLDIVGGSISYGASVQIYDWNGSMAQQYEIIKNQNGYYTIKNVKSNLYLGVTTNWNQMKSSRLVQGVNASSKGAQFIFTRNSDGSWIISSAWDRRYVFDLYGGSTNNGSPIQIYSSNGTVAQSWKLLKVKNSREEMDKLASQNKDAIADGTYFIASSLNTSYVFDVYGGSKSDFGNITIYKNNGTVAQGWKIVHDSKGYVTFMNVGSNKVLDVYGGQNVNGQNVVQYTSNNSYAQKWIVVNVGSGYKIVSALDSNYVLDLYGGRVQNFSNIQIHKSNNTKAQTWSFIKYESPRDHLNAMAKEYNADITESTYVIECYTDNNVVFNASNGNVQLANANKVSSQKWKIKKDAMGYITFINVDTNKALDVYGGKAESFTNVWQYAYNDTYAQKWIARKNSDGSLTFVSALDKDYVLDIYGGRIQNEGNIHIYRDNGTNAQKFKLTRV